ncbi:MAG: penicillin-binding protein 2 [Synergistaceae bacterium]|jgi:cell division protein FtsI (penicillin-binding protein 3)/stage V sporulation protein D (sporulation-specific penicillin-binding protein)|nr:penicillin-binding protein 2 [Synergistaceae bacterium]
MNILALSKSMPSFFIDPLHWSLPDAEKLRGLLPESVIAKISAPMDGRYVRVARMAVPELAQKIQALELKGLYKEEEKKREYPNGTLLSHVLGFCDIDGKGQAGIELAWDSTLSEPPGYRILFRRPGGRPLPLSTKSWSRSAESPIITLTVDIRIQHLVEKYLDEVMVGNKAKWGAVLCMDPNTGAVLSMASWPVFDPNNREELSDSKNIINNAVGRAYEPGSTFKPVFMGIALESGLVRADEAFNCPARIKIADGFISEAYPRAMGKISTSDVLVKSSNVGMAQIGIRAKPIDMYRTLLNWGFGKVSGIELSGTEKGLLASPGQWRGVVPANISIGQGLAVTPLQLITAIAAIVNGGELLSPYIVQEAVNSEGAVVYRGGKTVIREVLTPETCSWLRGVMRETVLSGTGRQAGTEVTQAAAKTGTAQVAEKGKYIKDRYVSSFVGFWPYENPQYLMLIVIGEPSSGKYYGGELVAPMFKKIVENMAEWGIFGLSGEGTA